METKNTPGPWRKGIFDDLESSVSIFPEQWNGKENVDGFALIAQVSKWGRRGEIEISSANHNATLIATSPELLAELIAIADRVDNTEGQYQLAAEMIAAQPKLKELIRKATQP
jgi:hypothetical protein